MGSPWPWTQEPVRTQATSGNPIMPLHNNNNGPSVNSNGKGEQYYYEYESSYYNNQRNHEFHVQNNNGLQSHHQYQQQNQNRNLPYQNRFPGHPVPLLTHDYVENRKRYGTSGYSFEEAHQNYVASRNNNNNNNESAKFKAQSQFATLVKEIPSWNIYFSDQKHRLSTFTDSNISVRPDSYINQLVSLCLGDTCITNFAVDAIVNSTTEDFCGTAGVDKLVHEKAGRSLREACKSLQPLGPGEAKISLGFMLPARYVIHTNGPLTEDADQLTGCYVNSLNLLLMHSLRTIVFPCISTGKKGLSKKFAAETALQTVRRFLEEHKHEVDRVIFCLHHQTDIEIYLRYMQIYFPVVPDRDVCITIV